MTTRYSKVLATTWLITGGCGFVGTNLADALLDEGKAVVVLDNLSHVGSKDNLKWLRSQHGYAWRFVKADIRDTETVAHLVQEIKPHVLVHLAGQVAMTTSLKNPQLDFEVNAWGTINVLEAVRTQWPEAVVLYPSTNKVYGSLEHLRYAETDTRYVLLDFPMGLDENIQLDGHSPYGCSKLAADQYVRDYHRIFGLRTVVFRHSSMYGGRQFASYDQGWVGWFTMKAIEMASSRAPAFTISGSGKQVRDVLHADDVVQAYIKATQNLDWTAGQIYNIGAGMENSLSLLELFQLLEQLVGHQMRFRRIDWRAGDQKVFVADYGKATSDFGWHPTVGKEEGIARMLQWCREVVKNA